MTEHSSKTDLMLKVVSKDLCFKTEIKGILLLAYYYFVEQCHLQDFIFMPIAYKFRSNISNIRDCVSLQVISKIQCTANYFCGNLRCLEKLQNTVLSV